MPRPSTNKKEARAARRRREVAVKFVIFGGAATFGPLLLAWSPIGKGLTATIPLGLLMLAGGAVMLWLENSGTAAAVPAVDHRHWRPAEAARREPVMPLSSLDENAYEYWRADATTMARDLRPTSWCADAATTASDLRPTSWSAAVFDVIEWRRFEAVVEALFRQAGFETRSQSHGADQGVDVWLYSNARPDVAIGLIQCKHWLGKRVGVDKIRELRGVMAAMKVERGLFATTSTFTDDAVAFAKDNDIDLLDVNRLIAMIARRPPEDQQKLLDVALEGDYGRPTCVNCGIKMVERTSRKDGGKFWGCKNYPGCKTTLPMRAAGSA